MGARYLGVGEPSPGLRGTGIAMIENKQFSAPVIAGLLRGADLVAVALAGVLAYYIRFGTFELKSYDTLVLVLVTLLAANVFQAFKLYEFPRLVSDPVDSKRILLALITVAFVALFLGYVTKMTATFSRIWIGLWAVSAIVGVFAVRFNFRFQLGRLQAKGWLTRRIVLVGAGPQGQRVAQHLAEGATPGITLVGIFDDRRSRVPSTIAGQRIKGGVDTLLKFIRRERVDEVIVALPWTAEDRLLEIMRKLRTAPVDVRLCPEGVAFQFGSRSFSDLNGLSVLNIYDRPLSSWRRVVKNVEDRVLATIILIFMMPLLVGVAIAIKFDSRGPVFFRQRRYGFNNELISVWKFRTLRHEATDWHDDKQVTRDDPRVTRLGAFLRKTSIDELPQFLNVIKGDMSIVGPRPHALKSKAGGRVFEEAVAEYFARHRVKPGITGWAQVHGLRGETDTVEKLEKRLQYDLYYIDSWSLWLDLKIIAMTPFSLVQRDT